VSVLSFVATVEDAGKRIDAFIAACAKEQQLGISREAVQVLFESGAVVLVGATLPLKMHTRVKPGDEVRVSYEPARVVPPQAEKIALDIIFEDDDIAVVNKPVGLVVHPAPGNREHTLVNALLHRYGVLSTVNPARPGIVHRLDKDTSGVMVVARTNHAHLSLAEQFAAHSIKRLYVALVEGEVAFDEDIIEASMGRHAINHRLMCIDYGPDSKAAKTYYRVLVRSAKASLLELSPYTGRTHQLRVHLVSIGHPILGDSIYGKKHSFPRLALHAQYLGFIHPRSEAFVEFSSPAPQEFAAFLKK